MEVTYRLRYLTVLLDPESLTWDLLDENYRAKLDKRRYVSLSRDRRIEAAKSAGVKPVESPIEDDDLYMPDEEQMSLFDVHMPGVLTLEELKSQIDLDHWRLLARGELVELCVCEIFTRPRLLSVLFICS